MIDKKGVFIIYYSEIKYYDIANGPGVRVSLFVSGCTHHCKGCFQPETWDPYHGKLYTKEVEQNIIDKLNNYYIQGLTFLGGDPLAYQNPESITPLAKKSKDLNKDVWCYTGDLFENVINDSRYSEFLQYVDVLVDGPFIEEKKDLSLLFRGSSNQRLIDYQKSKELGKVILWDS